MFFPNARAEVKVKGSKLCNVTLHQRHTNPSSWKKLDPKHANKIKNKIRSLKKKSRNGTTTIYSASMGACASSPSSKTTTTVSVKMKKSGGGARLPESESESFRRPSSIMVMDMQGKVKEYKQPVPAKSVLSENSRCYLCNSESVHLGTCMPRVPDDEVLLPGRIYFLVPLSHSDSPLNVPLLCDLAVKAASALSNPNNYYTHTK